MAFSMSSRSLVDDLVGPDLDVFLLGQLAGLAVGTDVEADDRGVGGRRQLDVVLGDATDGPVDEGELDLVALELAQASVSASSEPVTSALRMRLSVAASPAWIWLKMSSSLAPPVTAAHRGRGRPTRCQCSRVSATVRAIFSSGATTKRSPACGHLGQPEHLRRASTARPP